MNSIVRELQKACLSKDCNVESLLRKAYLVSEKLDLNEISISKWINNEQKGYENSSDVPEYRKTSSEIKAHNPYRGWIPVRFGDEDIEKPDLDIRLSVSEINTLIEQRKDNPNGRLYMPIPGKILIELQNVSNCNFDMAYIIPNTTLPKIIENVKDYIFQWSLKLEKKGILGENLTFTFQEKEQVSNDASTSNSVHIHHSTFNSSTIRQENMNNSNVKKNYSQTNKGSESKLLKVWEWIKSIIKLVSWIH